MKRSLKASGLAVAGLVGLLGWGRVSQAGFDPQGPELPDYIDSSGLSPLAGLQNDSGPAYLIVGFQMTDQATTDSEDYFEEFEVPDGETTVQFYSAPVADTYSLSNAGYFLSPTLIPLDSLNSTDLPPGGPYTPLPSLDNTLSPGGSLSADIDVPEPASLALIVLAMPFLAIRRRKLV